MSKHVKNETFIYFQDKTKRFDYKVYSLAKAVSLFRVDPEVPKIPWYISLNCSYINEVVEKINKKYNGILMYRKCYRFLLMINNINNISAPNHQHCATQTTRI